MNIEKAYDKKVSTVYHSFESTIINTPHLVTSLAPIINGTASSIDEFDPITGNIRLENLRITQNAKIIDLCIKNSTNILKEQLVFKLTLLNEKELSPKVEVIEKEVQPEIGNYDKQMTNEMNILFLSEIEKYLANGQIKIDELLKYRTTKLPDIFYRNHVDEIANDYWLRFGKSKIFTIEFDDQQWCKLLERNIISIADFEKYKKWDLLEKFGSEEQKKKALNKKSLLRMEGDGDDIWVYAKKW